MGGHFSARVRRFSLFLLVIVLSQEVRAEAPTSAPVKDDLATMQGHWQMVSGEVGGAALPQPYVATGKRICVGDQLTVLMGGRTYFKATIALDESKTPKTIDYRLTEGPFKDKVQQGIYELPEDGTFRSCFSTPGADRPADFVTKPGDGRTLSVWKKTL